MPIKKVWAFLEPIRGYQQTEAQRLSNETTYKILTRYHKEITQEVATSVTWIKGLDKKVKAVVPNCKGDHESIINFTTENIVIDNKTYTTAEYCSRITGLLAGTPMNISATFAPLNGVVDFTKKTMSKMDGAINKGEKVKKIKVVDAMHMIHDNIRKTPEDSYLGKYVNSYDNKCLLITAIQAYLDQLVLDGILDNKFDNKVYVDVESLNEQQLKEYNTKDKVFLKSQIKILDAIGDVELNVRV